MNFLVGNFKFQGKIIIEKFVLSDVFYIFDGMNNIFIEDKFNNGLFNFSYVEQIDVFNNNLFNGGLFSFNVK